MQKHTGKVPVLKQVLKYIQHLSMQQGRVENSPAAAVPVSTKIPEPIIAPMPSAVSDHGPSDFGRRCPGLSESEISLSMDFLAKSWLARKASLRETQVMVPENSDAA